APPHRAPRPPRRPAAPPGAQDRHLPRRPARARRRPPRPRPRLARSPDRVRAHPAPVPGGTNPMTKIRLAIAGMGNCASSLVQGLTYYKDADPNDRVPGLMHVVLGGYHVRDIELVAAFDVDATKVGCDASTVQFHALSDTSISAERRELVAVVVRGRTLDGSVEHSREVAEERPAEPVDVAQVLRDTKADVLVSYLPV